MWTSIFTTVFGAAGGWWAARKLKNVFIPVLDSALPAPSVDYSDHGLQRLAQQIVASCATGKCDPRLITAFQIAENAARAVHEAEHHVLDQTLRTDGVYDDATKTAVTMRAALLAAAAAVAAATPTNLPPTPILTPEEAVTRGVDVHGQPLPGGPTNAPSASAAPTSASSPIMISTAPAAGGAVKGGIGTGVGIGHFAGCVGVGDRAASDAIKSAFFAGRAIASNVRKNGSAYSRELVRAFQANTGLPATGIYDDATRQQAILVGVPASYAPPAYRHAIVDRRSLMQGGEGFGPLGSGGGGGDEGAGSSIRARRG